MYPWIYFIIFLFVAVAGSMATRNRPPFKTEQVKEIWQNMTKSEQAAANKKSFGFGVIVGAILGVVPSIFGLIIGIILLHSALKGMIVGMLLLFPVVLLVLWKLFRPHMADSWRLFFASTEWAKSQGLQAKDIRLFKWEM